MRRGVRPQHGRRLPAGHDRPLRRAARRAVLDDRSGALRLHADEQHRRQPQRDVRDRRHRHRHPPGQARDDGRVRHAQHRHRGGVARGRAQRPQGPRPLPKAARLLLPPVQGARQPQHRVRVPHLGDARHRPQPGGRVRRGHRADQARPAAGDALRLRRRVRHGAQPDGDPGGARPLADRLRQRLADARSDQHRGHGRMYPARRGEPGRPGRVPRVQPVHRAPVGPPDRRDDRRGVPRRGDDRAGREPARRGRGPLLQRQAHGARGPRAEADAAVDGADRPPVRGRRAPQGPRRPRGDHADGSWRSTTSELPQTSTGALAQT